MTDTKTLDGELTPPESRPRPGFLSGRGWRWLAAGLVVTLLVLLGWGLRAKAGGPLESGPAPDFSLTTFQGETVTLSKLRNQVVIINFWASWCPPCREEAPYLEATWRKYKGRGVVFIGLDYIDAKPNALAYIKEFDITYPNGPDIGEKSAQAYQIKGVPETYFVDKTGQLRGMHVGPLSPPTLDNKIDELLAE